MAPSEQPASSDLQALLHDGGLAGSWTSVVSSRSRPSPSTPRTRSGTSTCARPTSSTSTTTRPSSSPSFDAKVSAADGEVVLDGEIRVNRADYGMTWNLIGIAAMDVAIAVHAVFTRG
jgi:hypothetical protein